MAWAPPAVAAAAAAGMIEDGGGGGICLTGLVIGAAMEEEAEEGGTTVGGVLSDDGCSAGVSWLTAVGGLRRSAEMTGANLLLPGFSTRRDATGGKGSVMALRE